MYPKIFVISNNWALNIYFYIKFIKRQFPAFHHYKIGTKYSRIDQVKFVMILDCTIFTLVVLKNTVLYLKKIIMIFIKLT